MIGWEEKDDSCPICAQCLDVDGSSVVDAITLLRYSLVGQARRRVEVEVLAAESFERPASVEADFLASSSH